MNERIKTLIVVSLLATLNVTATALIARLDDVQAIGVAVVVWFVCVFLLGWIVNRKAVK